MEIKIYKYEKRLDVLKDSNLIKTYTIGIGKNEIGHKEREGDLRTPEGEYHVVVKNPHSKYHVSLGLSYPNKYDAKLGLDAGRINQATYEQICATHDRNDGSIPPWKTELGGEIFIHGDYQNRKFSEGCIRMTDDDVEELYNMTDLGTKVTIYP